MTIDCSVSDLIPTENTDEIIDNNSNNNETMLSVSTILSSYNPLKFSPVYDNTGSHMESRKPEGGFGRIAEIVL